MTITRVSLYEHNNTVTSTKNYHLPCSDTPQRRLRTKHTSSKYFESDRHCHEALVVSVLSIKMNRYTKQKQNQKPEQIKPAPFLTSIKPPPLNLLNTQYPPFSLASIPPVLPYPTMTLTNISFTVPSPNNNNPISILMLCDLLPSVRFCSVLDD